MAGHIRGGLALQPMTRFFDADRPRGPLTIAVALSTALLGCLADDPSLGTEESSVKKAVLESIGFTCEPAGSGSTVCKKCNADRCLYYQCEWGECTTCGTLAGDPPCTGLAAPSEQFFFFEAESGTISAPLTVASNLGASGASAGAAIVLPSGSSWPGVSTYSFTVGVSGVFYPWVRVRAGSTTSNGLAVRFDSKPILAWTTPVTGSAWSWARLESGGQPVGTNLGAGAHAFRIYGAESDTYIDRILVTDNPDFVPVADTYQAEGNAIVAPMVFGSTGGLAGVGYAWVPNGAGVGGSLQIFTPVPTSGTYYLWGRGNAPSTSDNAFDVSANFSTPVTWELPVTTSTGWAWSRANLPGTNEPQLVPIQGSSGFVVIDRRDTGTKLDKIIVTNDPGYKPVEATPQQNQ